MSLSIFTICAVGANFVDIYLQGMRERSMRSGAALAREIKLTDWSMVGNLSNRSAGVQIPRDICTRLKRYLYSEKCSWMISIHFGKLRRHLSWEVQHVRKLQTYITHENTQIFQKIIPEFSFPFDLFIIQFPEFLGEWLAFRKVD